MGVADELLMQTIIEALTLFGTKYAMVVHSDGLDEISTAGTTKITEFKDGQITARQLDTQDLGIERANLEVMNVADAKTSAKVLRDILSGKETGPRRDIVAINAAAAIIAGGLAGDFESALKTARESIGSGKALACLEKLIEISNKA